MNKLNKLNKLDKLDKLNKLNPCGAAARVASRAVWALILLAGTVPTQGPGKTGGAAAAPAKLSFAVVRVGEDVRVVPSAEVPALKKAQAAAYRDAVAKYQEARKQAAKAGEKFEDPKPKPAVVKVLKDRLKTEAAATAARDAAMQPRGAAAARGSASGKYLAVRVGEELRVVPATGLKQLQALAAQQHKQALATHLEAQKAARARKEKFEEPKPKPKAVKVVAKFGSAAEAEAYVGKQSGGGGG